MCEKKRIYEGDIIFIEQVPAFQGAKNRVL